MRANVRMLSEAYYPRSFNQSRKLEAAGKYVQGLFLAAGANVEKQEVLVDGERFFNVVAKFGPKTGPVLVIGAHYDSYGDAFSASSESKGYGADTHTPGADDNASGVAGLVELAFLLVKNPPRLPVVLVAYTLEEPPNFRTERMGSAWHVKSLGQSGQPVEMMISLEMIGYFSDAKNTQNFPLPGMGALYSTKGNFITIVSRLQDWSQTRRLKAAMVGASDLPVYSMNAMPLVPGVDFSDHLNYWQLNIPAVMVTDTAFNRNTQYHRAGDTYDKLDYHRMAKVIQGVYSFIVQR
ncbi:MAG: M28 family peptidase [Burkholderiales bacterium]